jgi:hypothetical protein
MWAGGYEYAACLVDARWARPTTARQTDRRTCIDRCTRWPRSTVPAASGASYQPAQARRHAGRTFCCQGQRNAMGAASSTLENLPEINVDTLLLMAVDDTHTRHQISLAHMHSFFRHLPANPGPNFAGRQGSPFYSHQTIPRLFSLGFHHIYADTYCTTVADCTLWLSVVLPLDLHLRLRLQVAQLRQ